MDERQIKAIEERERHRGGMMGKGFRKGEKVRFQLDGTWYYGKIIWITHGDEPAIHQLITIELINGFTLDTYAINVYYWDTRQDLY